jgi:hypothetical protein
VATRQQQAQARDRLIGHLEWLTESTGGPPHMGLYTWSSCWEDWVPEPPAAADPGGVYTADEFAALARFGEVLDVFWDAFDGDDEAGIELPEWGQLCAAAVECRGVFMQRGRLNGEPD